MTELKKEYPHIEYKTISFDFDIPWSPEGYEPLFSELDKIDDVSILVNNVGSLTTGYFADEDPSKIARLLNVNIVPQTFITHHMLPKLLERRSKGKKSAIVNISSVSYFSQAPCMLAYSSTKSLNHV